MSEIKTINHANGAIEKIWTDNKTPQARRQVSTQDFLDRFDDLTLEGILDSNSKRVKAFILKIQVRQTINLDSPRLIAGIDSLIPALLTEAEKVILLA